MPAWAIEGTILLRRDTVGLGDPIPLRLSFTAPPKYKLGPVHWALSADTLAQRSNPTLSVVDDSLYTVNASVALFALGDFTVSPDRLVIFSSDGDSSEVTFPTKTVTVTGVLTEAADSAKPAGYKPIIEPPLQIPTWAWTAIAVVLILIGAWWWLRRRPKRVVIKPETPRRPPWEIALERLEHLEAIGHHKTGESRLFAIELSEIVRQYLEYRYGFVALEQTTGEIKAALTHIDLTGHQRDTLIETLNGCDLAKYAKFHWPVPELQKSLALARSFVKDTIPKPKIEEPSA